MIKVCQGDLDPQVENHCVNSKVYFKTTEGVLFCTKIIELSGEENGGPESGVLKLSWHHYSSVCSLLADFFIFLLLRSD